MALAVLLAVVLATLCGCRNTAANPPGQMTPHGAAPADIVAAPEGNEVSQIRQNELFPPDDEGIPEPLSDYQSFLIMTGNRPDNDARIESIIEWGEGYNIAVHYPVFGEDWVDPHSKKSAEDTAGEFMKLVGELPEGSGVSQFYQDFELHRSYETLVSIDYEMTFEWPDGSSSESRAYKNYDLARRREIKLWDLLDGKYLAYISKYCFERVAGSGSFTGDADILKNEKLNPTQQNFSNFSIMQDYIVFYFPNIYSWDTGGDVPWVAIGYAELADFIGRDYSKLLGHLPGERPGTGGEKAVVILDDDFEVYGDLLQVALSFDDGPSSLTPQLLDLLAENEAHVTFFVLGNRVRANKDILERMIGEGHEIGNHTWSHKLLSGQGKAVFDDQVLRTQQEIADVINYTPKLLRPAYGGIDNRVKEYSPLPLILWSIDPQDWKVRDANLLVPFIVSRVKDGDIILMHDTYPSTIEAAERLLHELDGMGYKVVTVSQILRRHGENLTAGEVYRKNPPALNVSPGSLAGD